MNQKIELLTYPHPVFELITSSLYQWDEAGPDNYKVFSSKFGEAERGDYRVQE